MRKWAGFLIAVFISQTVPAHADGSDQLMSAIEGLKQQMARMQQTIDAQNLRLQQLESHKVLETPQPSVPVSAQPGDEAFPWLKGAKYGGDFRLRYDAFDYYNKGDSDGSTGGAADRTRNRFRIRLRWGFEKDYGDDWKVGFRLATGNTTDPNSTNQTLGNSGYFTYKNFLVERAYVTYEPGGLKDDGPLKGVKVGAGKFENPFLRYSTPMVWDSDVTPEGIYEQANLSLVNEKDNKLNFQATTGQFIVNENTGVDTDANIFAYQGALSWATDMFGSEQPVTLSGAVSYYDYTNWFHTVLASGNTAATSYLRTNSITADDFRVVDIYPELVFYVHGLPVTTWYDYAWNTANVGTDDAAQSGLNPDVDRDSAWGVGFKIGKAKAKGSWEASYGYYEIGADAVPAAFNDNDFGGPDTNGFTNRKGHKFGAAYQITDNVQLAWTGYIVSPLDTVVANTATGLGSARNEDVFRSQLDLVYKF